jgi:hypothetical protein
MDNTTPSTKRLLERIAAAKNQADLDAIPVTEPTPRAYQRRLRLPGDARALERLFIWDTLNARAGALGCVPRCREEAPLSGRDTGQATLDACVALLVREVQAATRVGCRVPIGPRVAEVAAGRGVPVQALARATSAALRAAGDAAGAHAAALEARAKPQLVKR